MPTAEANSQFPATEWTVVLRVRAAQDERTTHEALASLCARYWYPLYAFARRRGLGPHDAEDRTQDFFAQALRTNLFAAAEQELGKLRAFLIVAFERHLNRVRGHEHALKRGGGKVLIPIDTIVGEERYAHEPMDHRPPELIFERSWAMTILQSAIRQLGVEEAEAGRTASFRELEAFLIPASTEAGSYLEPARRLGVSEEAFRQGVSRLRRKFRVQLRREVAATLREPDEQRVDEELAALRAALSH